MSIGRRLMDWLRARRGHERLPPGLVRMHPDDLRAEALAREQARVVARLEALQIRVDLPRRGGDDDRRQEGEGGSVSR